nr:MAG TPA: hypothetical protein [Caudoviricetes sp.]
MPSFMDSSCSVRSKPEPSSLDVLLVRQGF